MRLLRLVLDTNVYIAAALSPHGYSARLLRQAGKRFELYVSPDILAEVSEKLVERAGYTKAAVSRFTSSIEAVTHSVQPQEKINAIAADPDDDRILECAVEAQAHLVVSNDPHLYTFKQYRDIRIVRPHELEGILPDEDAAVAA